MPENLKTFFFFLILPYMIVFFQEICFNSPIKLSLKDPPSTFSQKIKKKKYLGYYVTLSASVYFAYTRRHICFFCLLRGPVMLHLPIVSLFMPIALKVAYPLACRMSFTLCTIMLGEALAYCFCLWLDLFFFSMTQYVSVYEFCHFYCHPM